MNRLSLAAALAVLVVASVLPLDGRFATHMVQHLAIGDLAPLLIVAALRRPRVHPLVALPVWAANLVLWHVPLVYDAALRHAPVHALQHASLFAGGLLLWGGLLAAATIARRLAYAGGMMVVNLALAQVLLWSSHQLYAGYGLSDQRAGGGVMLVEGSLMTIAVVVWQLRRLLQADAGAAERRTIRYARNASR
jgi:putative membrane protein